MNIFDKKNINLFTPDGIEFISDILQSIGYDDFTTNEARRDGLRTINKLFELELIEVFHWGNYQNELKNKVIPDFDKMMYIQELWHKGADFEDFTNMPMFKFKDWYLNALNKNGMTSTTNWGNFVKKNIGDLEKWIKENRPKD